MRNIRTDELLNRHFWRYWQRFCEGFSRTIWGSARTCQASTEIIAQIIAVQKVINFECSSMLPHRLLRDRCYQINDRCWQCQNNMTFDCLRKKHSLKKWNNIHVNAEYTMTNDDFWTLYALLNGTVEKDIIARWKMRSMICNSTNLEHIRDLLRSTSSEYRLCLSGLFSFS
jgi:hypothetical protein